MSLIIPARTHLEVMIVAVAARDKKKAEAYAKRHGIPIVHENYEGMYFQQTTKFSHFRVLDGATMFNQMILY